MPMKYVALYQEESTGDPFLDLACAVIRCAMRDYAKMKALGRDTANGLDAERFILSDFFSVLCLGAIDGRKLLDDIDEEVQRCRERNQRAPF